MRKTVRGGFQGLELEQFKNGRITSIRWSETGQIELAIELVEPRQEEEEDPRLLNIRRLHRNEMSTESATDTVLHRDFLLKEIDRLRVEVDFRKRREESIIEACERVADGGQYRADIIGAINRIREERDEARNQLVQQTSSCCPTCGDSHPGQPCAAVEEEGYLVRFASSADAGAVLGLLLGMKVFHTQLFSAGIPPGRAEPILAALRGDLPVPSAGTNEGEDE